MSKRKDKTKNLSYHIYMDLKKKILTLELPPGKVIKEVEVGQLYGSSRTPTREAIQKLMSDSFVVFVPGVGKVVAPLTVDAFTHIYDIRMSLEILSAKLATIHGTAEEFEAVKENVENQLELFERSYNPSEFLKWDREFHLLLAKIGKNPYLYRQVENMYELFSRYNYFFGFEHRFSPAINEHERILKMVLNRDTYGAQQVKREHMGNMNTIILIDLARGLGEEMSFEG